MTAPHVLVIGAGIVGASLAYHLAQAGARVTVLEAGEPGGVATRQSWAWINATWGNPEPYFRLRVRAMQEWRRLERDVPGLGVAWCGGLYWDKPAVLDAFLAQHTAWGYRLTAVSRAEIERLEPALAAPPDRALHAPDEGVVEPLAAALVLLDAARGSGATVIGAQAVRDVIRDGDRVTGVRTDGGRIDADEVVLAAGVVTADLARTAGVAVRLVDAPGLVVASRPHARLLNGLTIPPGMELRQTAQGRVLAVGAFDGGADADGAAAALLARARNMLRGGAALTHDWHAVARRPMPFDGFPLVGRAAGVDGLYIAVTHSGITLAPALGRFATAELLTGERHALLAPYGLSRPG